MASPNLSTNFSVSVAKQELAGILHGTTLNSITALNNVFYRAARQLLLDLDPQETIITAPIGPLFDQVWSYPISNFPDLKGEKVLDIRPQVSRTPLDQFSQTYSKEFDVFKQFRFSPNFNVDWNGGVKSLMVDATNLFTGILLNNADQVSSNGNWFGSGNVNSLTSNSVNFVSPTGSSLMFNIASGSNPQTATLTNSTMPNPINLTTHQNQSTIFWWVYLPQAEHFTSVSMAYGSDASDYWTVTATENWEGVPFVNGWNLIGVPWVNSVQTGTPNVAAINYLQAGYVTDGTEQTAVQLNYINSRLGVIYDILYYSKFLFRDASTGLFQETVTADDNLINLDTETFNLFFDLLAIYTLQQVNSPWVQEDMAFWKEKYYGVPNDPVKVGDLARYRALYKSQVTQPKSTYYRLNQPGQQKYYGTYPWA